MRFLAALVLVLWQAPAWAFDNEFVSGSLRQEHGHGELIRLAAEGTPFSGRVEELARAQRAQDFPGAPTGELGLAEWWRALVAGMEPDEQKKHFLRWYSGLPAWRAATRPLVADWADAVAYLRSELLAAYRAPVGQEAPALGRALHALQDSYSPAHVERGPSGRIRAMAYYPGSHHLVDERDAIRTAKGELTPEAGQAVTASRELLLGFDRERTQDEAAFERWIEGFTARYLALSPPRREVANGTALHLGQNLDSPGRSRDCRGCAQRGCPFTPGQAWQPIACPSSHRLRGDPYKSVTYCSEQKSSSSPKPPRSRSASTASHPSGMHSASKRAIR